MKHGSSTLPTSFHRRASSALCAAAAVAGLACTEPIQVIDGCSVQGGPLRPVTAEILVYPGFLKSWEFTPSIAHSEHPERRFTHCKGLLRFRHGFADLREARSFQDQILVFTDSVEIGRADLRPSACLAIADLGFDPDRYVAIRESREITWGNDTPPRATLSSPVSELAGQPLSCRIEPFPPSDYSPTGRELRFEITLPRAPAEFKVNGLPVDPVQIGFPESKASVAYLLRLSYPLTIDPATVHDKLTVATSSGNYSWDVSFPSCATHQAETALLLVGGNLVKQYQTCN